MKRHGASHDIFTDGIHTEIIPRPPDIKENLAKALIKGGYIVHVPDFDALEVNTVLHQVKFLVDVDFDKHRKEYDNRAVRKKELGM